MEGKGFVFDYVHLFYYKWHEGNPNRGESHIDSPDWLKNKKATVNSPNKRRNKKRSTKKKKTKKTW